MKFPQLTTPRLLLRRMELSDLPSLISHVNNEKISDQILNIPYPYSEEDAIRRLNFVIQGFDDATRYVFAITMKDRNELIGEIGLHLDRQNSNAQFGYWVAEPFWGRGIATEATSAVLRFGFGKLQLHKIYATHYPSNTASAKVMLKNGMIREGELKDHYRVGDSFRSVIQYRLTRDEYSHTGAGKS